MPSKTVDLLAEFERQSNILIEKEYPQAAKLSRKDFLKHLTPLARLVETLKVNAVDLDGGYLPFVIVTTNKLVPTSQAMAKVERQGKEGVIKLYPHEPTDFQPIESVPLPKTPAYLLVNIDRGKKTINITPDEAMELIAKENRSPLTIDEGVAIVTHYPDFLMKNNCFSLLASRHIGDKRVPAIWINSKKHPNLGWCWEGNPHTWLGSASCKERVS